MLSRQAPARRRTGTASVEAAVVLSLVVVPLLIGVWEVGQLVHATQVVANGAREGARLAAQGLTITSTGSNDITFAPPTSGPYNPNVQDTVYEAIATGGLSGLQKTDVTITLTFLNADGTVSTAGYTDPYQAPKLQRFRVSVSVPFAKVRWVNLGLVNPTTVSYSVDWFMLVDSPFSVNTNLPNW